MLNPHFPFTESGAHRNVALNICVTSEKENLTSRIALCRNV